MESAKLLLPTPAGQLYHLYTLGKLTQAYDYMCVCCWLQVGIALVASVLRARYNRIEPVERVSVQPKGRSYSRTLFARGT